MEIQHGPPFSLYEQLGGSQTIDTAVDLFFLKAMEDDAISPFFRWTHMRQEWDKPKAYLVYVIGGPSIYDKQAIEEIHTHLRSYTLSVEQWEAILTYMKETLSELGISQELVDQVQEIALALASKLEVISA